jgi:hypothetical protein
MRDRYRNSIIAMILIVAMLSYFTQSETLYSPNFKLEPITFASGGNASSGNYSAGMNFQDEFSTENTSSTNYQLFTGFNSLLEDEIYNATSDQFAVSAWFKKDDNTSSYEPIACRWNDTYGEPERSFCLMAESDDKIRFYVSHDGSSYTYLTSSKSVPKDQWAFVVGAYNNTHLNIFIDGELDSSMAYVSGIWQTNKPMTVGGAYFLDSMRYFNGTIDEVAYYNSTLSDVVIYDKYEQEKTRYEVLISRDYSFDADKLVVARVGFNNFSEAEYYDDDYTLLLEHFERKEHVERNNATLYNITFDKGKFRQAAVFDGESSYVDYGDNYDVETDDFTIESWIKTNYTDNNQTIVHKGDGYSGSSIFYGLWLESSGKVVAGINNNSVISAEAISSVSVSDNTWHHITTAFDRDENIKIYVDGTLTGTTGISDYAGSIDNSNSLIVGRNSDSAIRYFNGSIDELRISSIIREPYSDLNKSFVNISELGKTLEDGQYYWKVRTTDLDIRTQEGEQTYSKWSEIYTFKIESQPPVVFLENQTNETGGIVNETQPILTDQNITFRVNATDLGYGVDRVWMTIWKGVKDISAKLWEGFLDLIDGFYQAIVNINITWQYGEVNYTIYANDTYGRITEVNETFYIMYNTSILSGEIEDPLEFGNHTIVYSYYNLSNGTIITDGECNATLEGITYDMAYNSTYERYHATINSTNHTLNSAHTVTYECSRLWHLYKITTTSFTIQDTTNPAVTALEPTNGSNFRFNNIAFNYTVFDLHSIHNCTITLDGKENTTEYNLDNLDTSSHNLTVTNIPNGLNQEWNITCYDNSSNKDTSTSRYINVDIDLPEITLLDPPNNSFFNSDPNKPGSVKTINFSITDFSPFIAWWSRNNSITNSTSFITVGSNYAINTSHWEEGELNLTIWANDSVGNIRELHYIFTVDLGPPIFVWLTPEPSEVIHSIQRVSVNATDSLGNISSAWVWLNGTGANENQTMEANFTMYTDDMEYWYFDWNTTNYTDGTYTLKVYGNDTAGNEANTTTRYAIVDNTEPSVSLSMPLNMSWSNESSNSFEFIPDDANNITNCSLLINDTVNQTLSPITKGVTNTITTTLQTANYTWSVRCTDEENNINTSFTREIYVDLIYPELSYSYPTEDNNTYWSRSYVSVNVSITEDNFNNVTYVLKDKDGVYNQTTYDDFVNYTVENLSEGRYWYYAIGKDKANNVNNTFMRTLYLDRTAPNITLNNPQNNSISGTESNTFSFTPADATGSDNCSLIINNEINKTSSYIINGTVNSLSVNLPTGEYYWRINCTDLANNEGLSETRYVKIDLTAPVIEINVTPSTIEFAVDSSEINWTINDPNTDYDYLTVYYPSGTVMGTYTVNITLTPTNLTELGNYSLTVWANDSANNIATSTDYLYVEDTIRPNLYMTSPDNGSIFNVSNVNFEFNVSDYHSVGNCSLKVNNTINQTSIFENNITKIQFFNLTNYPDGEIIEWNITCYDNSSNSNTSLSRYFDIDTKNPEVEFTSDSYEDDFYINAESITIRARVVEPHLSVVLFNWNGTAYIFNRTSTTQDNITYTYTETTKTFKIDNVNEGRYDYYVYSNDSLLHENTSETRTITIDRTDPSEFSLVSPADNTETTDLSPAFNWNDTIETNFDNYTLEISQDESFATLYMNVSTTTSEYQITDDNPLGTGEWYWRVRATDKANNQYTTSRYKFTIGAVTQTETVIGPGGGGGGGGGKIKRPGIVNVIQPGPVTMFTEDSIITPIYIANDGDSALKGVKLTAEASSPDIEVKLYEDRFPVIPAKSKVSTKLKITSKNNEGQYSVSVRVDVDSPPSSDIMRFFVNLVGFGKGNETLLEEKLLFIGKLFESNPECLELKELVDQANNYLAIGDEKKALSSIETAIESCNTLIKEINKDVERSYTKPTEPKKTLYILISEILSFFIIFSFIYRYFRRKKEKNFRYRGAVKRNKKGVFIFLLIIGLLSGGLFFLSENYTGFYVFSQESQTEFDTGIYNQTQTDGENITLLNDTLDTYYVKGEYTSEVFNANYTSDWQEIIWGWTNSTSGDNITIQVRTSDDNISWTAWSSNLTNGTSIKINATYIQYRATLFTDNNTKTPYLHYVNISYYDANFPSFSFVSPTPEDGLCTTELNHFINVSLIEPNEDTFGIGFNNTNYTYTNNTYWFNASNLTEGTYSYFAFANDTLNHQNQSETRNFTIDLSAPTSFNLLNPTEENRTTESTPFFNWEDTTDLCLDNYTIEISETEDFASITYKFTNSSSNYQVSESESLDNGTWYWRVVAYDKVGNSYTTDYTYFNVGVETVTTTAPGSGGGGGGGGKKVTRVTVGLELIIPSALSFYTKDSIIVPLNLMNNGTDVLRDIKIKVKSKDLVTKLSKTKQDILIPKQNVPINLIIYPHGKTGKFDITITSNVAFPQFSDSTKIFVDLYEFGTGNETEIKENLEFAGDFIRQNDICSDLLVYLDEARVEFENKNYERSKDIIDKAIESCKDLVANSKSKPIKKEEFENLKKYLIILESIIAIFVFAALYSYYRRIKFKHKKIK